MKNYRVTVNGQVYDVQVEETAAGGAPAATPAPVAAPQAAAQPSAPVVSGGGTPVTSPMPGVILDIKVNKGDTVSDNQVVVILEAMKMENEIVTPVAGSVAEVLVQKGDNVNSGDTLILVKQ